MFLAQFANDIKVERVTQCVRHHDGLGLGADSLAQTLSDCVVGAELDVNDDRTKTVLNDRVHGSRESRRDCQNLVTRLEGALPELETRETAQSDQVGAGTTVDEESASGPYVARKRALERRVKATGGQPAIEGGIDESGIVGGVENLAGNGDG
jgi:hypothetical protein